MLAHGIVSGALFFCIGIIYERFKSRFLWYYGGVAFLLPLYSIFLFIFILANISFPTTSNFIGEMLLFIGIFKDNFVIGFFAALSMFWGVIYNVWTYNRICFGNIKFNYNVFAKHGTHSEINTTTENLINKTYLDIDKVDFYILSLLIFLLFLTGINSSLILDYVSINSTVIVDRSIHILSEVTLSN
jgi:NADH:ubiquinone oxidoreductase subunit 4 (subunit M)